jgi:hypothetical protein
LQIQEMAFMIVAVVFFFMLVILFVLSIYIKGLYGRSNEIGDQRTMASITNLADSPEFRCVLSKSNCVDSDKLIVLLNRTQFRTFYPFSSLKVVKSTAFNKDEAKMVHCTIANYPLCDIFVVYDDKVENEKAVSTYISLCRKEFEYGYTYDRCEIAKIIAGTKIKVQEPEETMN